MAKSRSTGTASTDVIQVVDSTIGGYTTKCDAGVSSSIQYNDSIQNYDIIQNNESICLINH